MARVIHQGREKYGPMIGAIPGQDVRFRYTNWKSDTYVYVVEVESLQYGHFHSGGIGSESDTDPPVWVLHGQLISRDDDTRPDMNPRRRTFILDDLQDLEVIT